jgi:hypothetical protein
LFIGEDDDARRADELVGPGSARDRPDREWIRVACPTTTWEDILEPTLKSLRATFSAVSTFETVGSWSTSVAVADIDLDAIPDLVTADFGGDAVTVLFGDGNGGFPSTSTFAAGVLPTSVAVVDLDGNGRLDIVTTNQGDNAVSVLLPEPGAGLALPFGIAMIVLLRRRLGQRPSPTCSRVHAQVS